MIAENNNRLFRAYRMKESLLLHRETGKTFSEILLEKRMEHAAILIKGTDLSNEEIAEALGYSSTTNYYKAFRRFYGMTPGEYEKRHPSR